jgi:hypothetical protein
MKRPVFAWDAGWDVLVLACPSSRGGLYLVAARPAGKALAVIHACPAAQVRRLCWHVTEAIRAYRAWRPEAEFESLRVVTRWVRLDRRWRQIPVPGREEAGAEEEVAR